MKLENISKKIKFGKIKDYLLEPREYTFKLVYPVIAGALVLSSLLFGYYEFRKLKEKSYMGISQLERSIAETKRNQAEIMKKRFLGEHPNLTEGLADRKIKI